MLKGAIWMRHGGVRDRVTLASDDLVENMLALPQLAAAIYGGGGIEWNGLVALRCSVANFQHFINESFIFAQNVALCL